jgi:DNA segregation ATPase FtsK/SpoIIIE, S-DNA-T family
MGKDKKGKSRKAGNGSEKGEDRILGEIFGILVFTFALLSAASLFVGPEIGTLYALNRVYFGAFGYTAVMVPALAGLFGAWAVWRSPAFLKATFHLFLIGLLIGAWINLARLFAVGGAGLTSDEYAAAGGAASAFVVSGLAGAVSCFGVFIVLFALILIYVKLALKISYTEWGRKAAPHIIKSGRFAWAASSAVTRFMRDRVAAVVEKRRAKQEEAKAGRERETELKAKKLMEQEAARLPQPADFVEEETGAEDVVVSDIDEPAVFLSDETHAGAVDRQSMSGPEDVDKKDIETPEDKREKEQKKSRPRTSVQKVTDSDGEGTIVWRLPEPDDWLEKSIDSSEAMMDNTMRDKLEATLKSFQVPARISAVVKGAAFTRFEIELEPGTKVSRIVTLESDIALSLATDAKAIRIEAPIPGKSAIGIEVPNKERAIVHLRSLIQDPDFQKAKKPLSFVLGGDIAGKPVFTNLVKMPHLLVAGSTNSGKSVCINVIITSIIAREFPSEVRFIMVDMKRVELTPYDGIPHLLTPVIKEASEAANGLRWVCEEMDRRYKRFAEVGVRDITGYNNYIKEPEEKMFRIVVIIDELADLMMVSSANMNIENYICRITQLARATGIHVILATQRPDTKVITGTIKNNIPSRISFAVASQIDSRTVLDRKGAESLLGMGDMLFLPIDSNRLTRLQGAFVSDDEVKKLVNFWKAQGQVAYGLKFSVPVGGGGGGDLFESEDEALYKQAVEIVANTGQASISMIQRRLRIGYNRAARLVDLMEERHVVGPYDGSRPREVLVTPAMLDEI